MIKDDGLYLTHIDECLDRIEEYTAGGSDAFFGSTLIQDAVLRNLQTLAESSQHVSEALRGRHPEVPWRELSGFRNVVVHDYLGVDLFTIWQVVEVWIPRLRPEVALMHLEATTPRDERGEPHLLLDPATTDRLLEWVAAGIVGGGAFEVVRLSLLAFWRDVVRSQGRKKAKELEERVFRALKHVKRKPSVSEADLRLRAERIFRDADS